MSIPLVTVLIDTYNHELFIKDAINSVLSQDFPASQSEVIVVDDGSTDATPEIVREFEPRVRLLSKDNGGQGSAFNAGIAEARGTIIAFLDGDDWWAPGKLTAVCNAFASEPDVGLVGHGLTEVHADSRWRTEVPRELTRFRIISVEDAKAFRMRRGFLGTSRMAYRRELLQRIGPVPETLEFEADEYFFTLAGLFTDVLILRDSLTFYRLHGKNLFQLTGGSSEAIRRKQKILEALTQALEAKLRQCGTPSDIARTILECIEAEADVLRLLANGGYPWETVSAELRIMRIFHSDASILQHLFSCLRLAPALLLPADTYYRWRQRLSALSFYQDLRRKILPFPVPNHVERTEKQAS